MAAQAEHQALALQLTHREGVVGPQLGQEGGEIHAGLRGRTPSKVLNGGGRVAQQLLPIAPRRRPACVDPHSPPPTALPRIKAQIHQASADVPSPMAFFDSEIVQDEAKSLFGDYQQLMQLGGEYGKFDREGKKLYIERMEAIMDRYRVFMKRFELSEDFQAQLTVEQLRTQLGQFGLTPETMFQQMQLTLDRMKSQLEATG
jgi:hypothetical protein